MDAQQHMTAVPARRRLSNRINYGDIVPYGFGSCDTTAAPPEFSPVRVSNNLLFFSGVSGYDVPCRSVVYDPMKQIEKTFAWMAEMLKAADTDFEDVIMVTAYHVGYISDHMDALAEMRKKYWPKAPYPVWTSVQVDGLYYDYQVFEMQFTAEKKPCIGIDC